MSKVIRNSMTYEKIVALTAWIMSNRESCENDELEGLAQQATDALGFHVNKTNMNSVIRASGIRRIKKNREPMPSEMVLAKAILHLVDAVNCSMPEDVFFQLEAIAYKAPHETRPERQELLLLDGEQEGAE